ncbi:unnamed protein product [Callosobruchus maculatus]|uniref:Uncharacterized protein n=1 Tax=Callosobruchus maculatus TaxID=64391 RepID=A0A653CC00_CALMS|nr:unnamed protein product [Callosobruchus maculatus]
MFSFFVVYF